MSPDQGDRGPYSNLGEYLSLGAEIAAGLTAPILIGWWLDGQFDTSPWILLVGCLLGMANFFLIILNLDKRHNQKR